MNPSSFVRNLLFTALLFAVSTPLVGRADPLDLRKISADAKLINHINMDVARDSKMWGTLNHMLENNRIYKQCKGEAEQLTGMPFPKGLHDVTEYDLASDFSKSVAIIHAHIDREKMMAALRACDGYGCNNYRQFQIISWNKDGTNNFGTFYDGVTFVYSNSEEAIRTGLDVLVGKSACLKDDSPMAAGIDPELLFFMGVTDASRLRVPGGLQYTLFSQAQDAWFSVSEADGNALVKANIRSDSVETAEQLEEALVGIKAGIQLASKHGVADASGNTTTNAGGMESGRRVGALCKSITFKQDGKSVLVNWPFSLDEDGYALTLMFSGLPPTTNP